MTSWGHSRPPKPRHPLKAPLTWISRKQAAQALGLTVAQVQELIRTGVLRHWKDARYTHVLLSDVVALAKTKNPQSRNAED